MNASSGWLKRRSWPGFILINKERSSIPGDVTRHDLLADDWEVHSGEPPLKNLDDSEQRFMLLELNE